MLKRHLKLTLFLLLMSIASQGKPSVTVRLVQYSIEGNRSLDQFWAKVEREVVAGSKRKADIVLLPELISLDMWPLGKPEGKDETKVLRLIAQHSDEIVSRTKSLAIKYHLTVISGSTPRIVGGKLYNTLIIAKPSGEVILQNKMHLTRWERDRGFSPGDTLIPVKMDWGTLVVLVCYDSEIPSLSSQLAKLKPQLILVPSMTEGVQGRTRVRVTSQARSIEHLAYVGLTGTVGKPSRDFLNDGQAVFFAPPVAPFTKPILKEGPLNRPSSITLTLDMAKLKTARASPPVYPAEDQHSVDIEF